MTQEHKYKLGEAVLDIVFWMSGSIILVAAAHQSTGIQPVFIIVGLTLTRAIPFIKLMVKESLI